MKIQISEYMLPIKLMKFVIIQIQKIGITYSQNQNVADDATRCRSFSDLNSNYRWFNGPEFIHENVIIEPKPCDIYRTDKTKLNINAITEKISDIILSTETKPLLVLLFFTFKISWTLSMDFKIKT